jgi:hypothetical protein
MKHVDCIIFRQFLEDDNLAPAAVIDVLVVVEQDSEQ